MKRELGRIFLVCCAVLAAGCANRQAVKKGEPGPSAAAVAAAPRDANGAGIAGSAQKAEQQTLLPQEIKESAAERAERLEREARLARERKMALEKIYFSFDSASLSEQARDTLVKNAELLRKNQKATIRVEGNCDERGSDEYNLALGEKRARQAVRYLATLGIPEERLTAVSYGEERPVATGHDEESWAKNRRDEFVIVK